LLGTDSLVSYRRREKKAKGRILRSMGLVKDAVRRLNFINRLLK